MIMRILLAHNRYQQAGGEDAVLAEEQKLLLQNGVEVELYEQDNHNIANMQPLQVAVDTIWSRRTTAEITERIRQFRHAGECPRVPRRQCRHGPVG